MNRISDFEIQPIAKVSQSVFYTPAASGGGSHADVQLNYNQHTFSTYLLLEFDALV